MAYARAADGRRLWYEIAPTQGLSPTPVPPLLLVPGRTLDHRMWRSFAASLAGADGSADRSEQRRTVLMVDPRGTGRSEDPFEDRRDAAPWSTRVLAEDLAAVIEAADLGRVHVLGFSMGGRAAQWLAADRPDLVQALVLAGTAVADRLGPARPPEVETALRSGQVETLVELFYPPSWAAAHPDEARASVLPRTLSRGAMLAHAQASRDHDATLAVGRITAPTLVLHGAQDRLTDPEHGRILAAHVPGAHLEIVDGARHACWVDPARSGLARIRDHLREYDESTSITETLALLSDPVDQKRLAEAERSVHAGQVTSRDEMARLVAERVKRRPGHG